MNFMARSPEFIPAVQEYRDPPLTAIEEVGVHEVSHRLAGTVFNSVTVGESYVYGADSGVTFLYIEEEDPLAHYTIRIAMLEASLIGEKKAGIMDHSGCNHDQSMIRNIYNYVKSATNESVALKMLKDARNMARAALSQVRTEDLIHLGVVLANDPNSQQFKDNYLPPSREEPPRY